MAHPFEAEFERRGCERMVRLFHILGDMDGDIAAREDFGEFVRTVYIDLGKQLGFPKEDPELPCPDFKPASELPKTGALPVLPKQAVDLMPKETPKRTRHDESMATPAQVNAFLNMKTNQTKYAVIKKYLEARGLLEPGELTKAEAMDLFDELNKAVKR